MKATLVIYTGDVRSIGDSQDDVENVVLDLEVDIDTSEGVVEVFLPDGEMLMKYVPRGTKDET